jgi:biopolymer transport protein ExbD
VNKAYSAFLLIVGILSVQVSRASRFSTTTSSTNESGTNVIPTEDDSTLEVSIEETDKEYIVTSYVNDEKESQTIKNKETRDMKTIDNDGKVEYSNESDYIEKVEKVAPDPMISKQDSLLLVLLVIGRL